MLEKQVTYKPISVRSNQKGMATIEVVPVLVVFVLLINFTIGFFGVIHSGILNSMAARNYTFETLRNRTDFNYLRDDADPSRAEEQRKYYYSKIGYRAHGVIEEGAGDELRFLATRRSIKFTETNTGVEVAGTAQEHQTLVRRVADDKKASEVFSGATRDQGRSGVNPVWVSSLYGICLNFKCEKLN